MKYLQFIIFYFINLIYIINSDDTLMARERKKEIPFKKNSPAATAGLFYYNI